VQDARRVLREQDLHVTGLAAATFAERKGLTLSTLWQGRQRNPVLLEAVTRQLAVLLENEIKLTDALGIAMEEVSDKRFLNMLRDIRDHVASGTTVADALSPYEGTFGHMYISMVRVGETAGNLPEVLRRMAEHLREQALRRGQVGTVMIYPTIMVVVSIVVVTFLMTTVLPKIKSLLESFGAELPLPTRILMGFYNISAHYWPLMIIAVVLLVAGLVLMLKTEKGRHFWDTQLLRVPVLGDMIRKQQTVQFTSTLRTLLASGVRMADCMTVLLETSSNTLVRETVADLQESVIRGSDVSTVLRRSPIIPKAVAHMVAVGEQSGELEQVLGRLSQSLNQEVEISVARLNALLQPVMILIVACIVGFIVAAVMLPILQMGTSIG
jgi:type II secretory pathway component PulF